MGSLLAKQFSPKDLQGLALWLKADAGIALSGSDVTAWEDQSGNGNNATARTGNATLVSSVINGNPVLRFDGASNLITNDFFVHNYNTPITIIAVSKASASTVRGEQPTARYIAGVTNNGGYEFGLSYGAYETENPNFSNSYGISYVGGQDIESSPMGENEKRIASTINNGSEISFFLDGNLIGTADPISQSGGNNSTGAFSIGSDVVLDEMDNFFCTCDIAEIIIYNRALTIQERQQVEAYLNTKYAIYSPIKNTKIFIKKQNQTKLEPYSIDGGSTVYDANNIYIFKGGSINTLGVIFDLTPANTIGSADIIYFNGNSYYKKTGGFVGAGWRDQNSVVIDRSNTVIDPGTLIYFNPRSYKTTAVEVGAIIEKYNIPAKISLRPTCGYQNTNKLIEISGNNAPIAAFFNDIAFDYSSFADRCLSLGLDPATILNSLGGVDFNYNYVVIRAKTSSNFTSDSISDLGNGVINITTIGPSTGTVANRYRFFVMCKTGWKIVRFYGTDYNIKNNLNLLISDITNYQTNTIGELHYNDNIGMKSIFTTDDSYKVVKNEILQSNNRINYNIGYIPNQFTAIFDYKAGGGNGADGGYFYLFAKGTQSPNMGDSDSFPMGKYLNDPDNDAYRINFDEYEGNQQLAVSWAGWEGGDLIDSVGSVADNPLGLNFADGTWRNIKIQFDQGTFYVYINNELKLNCTDSNYNNRDKSGTNFGLGGYIGGFNNYHYFKNFKFYNYFR